MKVSKEDFKKWCEDNWCCEIIQKDVDIHYNRYINSQYDDIDVFDFEFYAGDVRQQAPDDEIQFMWK